MKHWISKNYKTLIITAFLVPIITVAIVSISHVTKWYGISNPLSWAIYLSIGVEIAALSALAAISADMGKKVYFPFIIVTLVQFIGNIFFAYSFIDINSQSFKDWVDLVAPLLEFMGVEPTDLVGHKRFLALFAGGMLPIISLSFLHMLVKFTEEDRLKEINNDNLDKKIQDSIIKGDLQDETNRLKLSERDLQILEQVLLNSPEPNQALKDAAKKYKANVETKIEEEVKNEESIPEESELDSKILQKEVLIEIMETDQEYGLYDDPVDNPIIKEDTYDIAKSIEQPEITPALSDEEVREMFMDEWERKFDLVDEEELIERNFYVDDEMNVHEVISDEQYEPSPEEEEVNFNTIPVEEEIIQEAPKFNIEESFDNDVPLEDLEEKIGDSFWRDHIQEDEDDLKKKL